MPSISHNDQLAKLCYESSTLRHLGRASATHHMCVQVPCAAGRLNPPCRRGTEACGISMGNRANELRERGLCFLQCGPTLVPLDSMCPMPGRLPLPRGWIINDHFVSSYYFQLLEAAEPIDEQNQPRAKYHSHHGLLRSGKPQWGEGKVSLGHGQKLSIGRSSAVAQSWEIWLKDFLLSH